MLAFPSGLVVPSLIHVFDTPSSPHPNLPAPLPPSSSPSLFLLLPSLPFTIATMSDARSVQERLEDRLKFTLGVLRDAVIHDNIIHKDYD